MLLDISHKSFLGDTLHTISRPTGRRLQCNRNEVKQKYTSALELYCRRHRIQSKINQIRKRQPPRLEAALNAIDKILGEGMRHAERKCRKLRKGKVPFQS